MEFFNEDVSRLVIAAVLGAVLGFEREWKGKAAGFRTLMLVSVGAALFTEISYHMSTLNNVSDATRIASNIVSGIGFIGAGLIFKDQVSVHGLTTAATIWAAAAVGMATGAGNYGIAVGTVIIAWTILVILQYLEHRLQKLRETRKYRISLSCLSLADLPDIVGFFGKETVTVKEYKLEKQDGKIVLNLTVRAPQSIHEAAIRKMLENTSVQSMDY